MRQYEPIWIELKNKNKAVITAPKVLHRRIIKAVCKEKDMDLGFKLKCSEECIRKKIFYTTKDSVIKFELKETLSKQVSFSVEDL